MDEDARSDLNEKVRALSMAIDGAASNWMSARDAPGGTDTAYVVVSVVLANDHASGEFGPAVEVRSAMNVGSPSDLDVLATEEVVLRWGLEGLQERLLAMADDREEWEKFVENTKENPDRAEAVRRQLTQVICEAVARETWSDMVSDHVKAPSEPREDDAEAW